MDQTAQLALKEKLKPPRHADVSAVANGIGSGAMLVGVPIMLLKLFNKTDSNVVTKFLHSGKGAVFTTVLGCAAGGWFGIAEAKRTREYRANLVDEILQLREELETRKPASANWQEKASVADEEKSLASAPAR